MDDVLLHEFMMPIARGLLAKRGFKVLPDEGAEWEMFNVGQRPANPSDADLLLAFTHHVYNDLMGWGRPVEECKQDENTRDYANPEIRSLAQACAQWDAQRQVVQDLHTIPA